MVLDAPEFVGVVLRGIEALENDALIAPQTGVLFDGTGIYTAKLEIGFGSDNEKGCPLGKEMETFEVQVASIHDVEGPRFRHQLIEYIDVVKLAVADMDERRDVPAQIQKRVQFDRGLGTTELGPRENRQTQIDGCGIERVDGLIEFDAEVLVHVKSSRSVDKAVGKLRVNAPVSYAVGIGQSISENIVPNPNVIQLVLLCTQASLDVSHAFAIGQLGKSHTEVLIETSEVAHLVMPMIALDAPSKGMKREIVHHL